MVSAFCENMAEGWGEHLLQRAGGPIRSTAVIFSDWGIKLPLLVPGGEHGCRNFKKCYILRFFYLNSDPACMCVCSKHSATGVHLYVYTCIWNAHIYTLIVETQTTSMWNNVAGCISRGTTFATEWMLSEWVTHRNVCELPRGVRDGMVCRSVCQKEADDIGATRVLLFLLQQWTKPGLVLFICIVHYFRFLSNFVCVSFGIHVRSVCCPLSLLVSLFHLFLSFLPLCDSHSFLILS